MSMPLSAALAHANRYAIPKAPNGWNAVVLSPGRVRATNGTGGVDIPCEDVDVEAAVDCAMLRKMVTAVGEGAIIKADKKKRLVVEGGGTRYSMTVIGDADLPLVDPPKKGWAKLPEGASAALRLVSSIAATSEAGTAFSLSGLRLTPEWCASATTQLFAVAWIKGAVTAPITIPAFALAELEGEIEVQAEDSRFWIRERATGQVRWSAVYDREWPDTAVTDLLAKARDEKGRVAVTVDPSELGTVAGQAEVVSDSAAEFKLALAKEELLITGSGVAVAADFRGVISCACDDPKATRAIGLFPAALRELAGVVALAGGDRFALSLADKTSPVILWGGSPIVIETVMMPRIMSEQPTT